MPDTSTARGTTTSVPRQQIANSATDAVMVAIIGHLVSFYRLGGRGSHFKSDGSVIRRDCHRMGLRRIAVDFPEATVWQTSDRFEVLLPVGDRELVLEAAA